MSKEAGMRQLAEAKKAFDSRNVGWQVAKTQPQG
jgi:hypothetical protein